MGYMKTSWVGHSGSFGAKTEDHGRDARATIGPPSLFELWRTRCWTETVRLRQAYGATRSWRERERNMPYYQTNPPFYVGVFDAMVSMQGICEEMLRRIRWVRFRKTNPPERCFWGET